MVKVTNSLAAAALVVALSITAQGQPPAGQAPPPQGQRGGNPGVFPAQQRPPGDPVVIARGKALYGVTCSFCHGPDLRGGQLNGPNLLRSQVVLNDQAGELMLPIVRGARAEKGMPPIPMSDDDVKAVAEYVHSIAALSPRQGMPPPGAVAPVLDVLVGDASAGRACFDAKCAACHSATGDLQGIATRIPDAKTLQNVWVSGGSAGGRGGRGAADRGAAPNASNPRAVTVTVTLPSGEKVDGQLLRIDDLLVSLTLADGTVRSVSRTGARPRVEVHDPMEAHRALLSVYTDKDMHDVTAYLATLK